MVAVGDDRQRYYLESWNDVTTEKKLRKNMQSYAMEITKAQEEERNRIARELHDETIQALFSVLTDIDGMHGKKEHATEPKLERLDQIQTKIGHTIDEVRRFCHELRPGVLDRFGLVPSLEVLAKEASQDGKLHCQLKTNESDKRLSPEVELVLFRATQEALVNIKKHSMATEAIVEVTCDADMAQVRISDNGCGFEPPLALGEFAQGGKLGLIGMQERIRLIGGKLTIDSKLDEGTTILIQVPLVDRQERDLA